MCLANAPPACDGITLSVMGRIGHPPCNMSLLSMVTGLSAMLSMHTQIRVLCAQGYEEAHCTDRRRDMHQQTSHGKPHVRSQTSHGKPHVRSQTNMFLQQVLSGLDAGSWRDSPHG